MKLENIIRYFDYMFKIAIVIISLGFLFVYYQSIDNNRYIFNREGEIVTVFDSKTGSIFVAFKGEWTKINPKDSK